MAITVIFGFEISEDTSVDKIIDQEHLFLEDEDDKRFLDAIMGKTYPELSPDLQDQVRDYLFKDVLEHELAGEGISYNIVDPMIRPWRCPACGWKSISVDREGELPQKIIEKCKCRACGTVFENRYVLESQVIK